MKVPSHPVTVYLNFSLQLQLHVNVHYSMCTGHGHVLVLASLRSGLAAAWAPCSLAARPQQQVAGQGQGPGPLALQGEAVAVHVTNCSDHQWCCQHENPAQHEDSWRGGSHPCQPQGQAHGYTGGAEAGAATAGVGTQPATPLPADKGLLCDCRQPGLGGSVSSGCLLQALLLLHEG